jgi:hypothetical protein
MWSRRSMPVGCQKFVTCPDLDVHVSRWLAMKIKTAYSSPTAGDVTVFSKESEASEGEGPHRDHQQAAAPRIPTSRSRKLTRQPG